MLARIYLVLSTLCFTVALLVPARPALANTPEFAAQCKGSCGTGWCPSPTSCQEVKGASYCDCQNY